MKTTRVHTVRFVAVAIVFAAAAGCSPQQTQLPPHNDTVRFRPDSANPSNVVATITFLNPVQMSNETETIVFTSALLLCRTDKSVNQSVELAVPEPTQRVSQCSFSIPEHQSTNCLVVLSGGHPKDPLFDGVVERRIELGDPNQ